MMCSDNHRTDSDPRTTSARHSAASCARPRDLTRRSFVAGSLGCASYLFLATAGSPARWLFGSAPRGRVIRDEPWGRVEEVGPGMWALVSTPLSGGQNAMRTLANGGIIAGSDGVLIVEGLASPEGARWLAEIAREETGRWPTHVVVSHYHGDHTRGLDGLLGEDGAPTTLVTETTRELVLEGARRRGQSEGPRLLAEGHVDLVDPAGVTEIDLGGRVVWLEPHLGHTQSDVTVRVSDPQIVWCGDLVWNGLFPNYVDAIPSKLSEHVRQLADGDVGLFVPGHGSLANPDEFAVYVRLLDDVGAAATSAVEDGVPAAEAAASYTIPETLGEWTRFSPSYYEVAFRAWERELTSEAEGR